MLSYLKRGIGYFACTRLCYISVEQRRLDTDRLSNPVVRDPNNPIDRVRRIFERDEDGTMAAEATWVLTSSMWAMFAGGLHGGIRHANNQGYQHVERNEATLYDSNIAARRSLGDKMFLSFGKGFFAHGIKVGFLVFTMVGTSTLLYNYRNKASISDYTAGGALAGAIYKFSLGPKGMISGGVFGGLFGTFAGAMMIGMLKLTGTTMPQLYSQTQIPFRQVDQQFHASFKKYLDVKDPVLFVKRPSAECPAGNRLDELPDLTDLSELKYRNVKIDSK